LTSSDDTQLKEGELEAFRSRGVVVTDGNPSRAAATAPVVAILCGKFNGGISARLCRGALDAFDTFGMPAKSITVAWVPGAFELPMAAKRAIKSGAHAVVCLGAVIRGDTAHFDFVAGECASGIQQVNLETGVPVIFGVLTTENVDQALERSVEGPANKGYEAALTALEMLDLLGHLGDPGEPTVVPA